MSTNEEVKVEYYENGNKMSERHYKDGNEDGVSTWCYEDGEKWKEITYEKGEKILVSYWNESGYFTRSEVWKDGKIVEEKKGLLLTSDVPVSITALVDEMYENEIKVGDDMELRNLGFE